MATGLTRVDQNVASDKASAAGKVSGDKIAAIHPASA